MFQDVGTTMELRIKNRKELLKLLIQKGSTTRNELKDAINCSYTTIGNLLGDLDECGFVWLTGEANSTGGRKAQIVKLHSGNFLFIVVNLSIKKLHWGVYDLEGRDLLQKEYICDNSLSADENFNLLLKEIKESVAADREKIKSIGVVIPGHYNPESDSIIDSSYPDLDKVKINLHVAEHFALPIFVMNDVRVAACKELTSSRNDLNINLIFFMVLRGSLGASIIINGKIYDGTTGCAGEVHTLPIWVDGKRSRLGMQLSPDFDMEKLSADTGKIVDEASFFELFRQGDSSAVEIFQKNIEVLSFSFAASICMFNPSDIVIGGFYNRYGDVLVNSILARLKEICDPWQVEKLRIRFSDITPFTLMGGLARQQIAQWVDELK